LNLRKRLIVETGTGESERGALAGLGETIVMAENTRTQNQPSHESQVKGGEHSHETNTGGNRTPPSKEDASKGGQHSHSGGNR
jgi:hypothetical protein